jgi:type IV pilus assembly protein PilV
MLRVDTERRFLPRFKNRGLAPSNVSKGFSLIEILIALVILSISLLALAALMVTTTQNNSFGGHMTEAATFAQDMLERLRASPWENVGPGADQVTGSTGIRYDRRWVVSPNPISPSDTLREVTISINWNNNNNSITFFSAISK